MDRDKQAWTIEIIAKQVSKNNPQDSIIFTDNIKNIGDSSHLAKIHFLINTKDKKIFQF